MPLFVAKFGLPDLLAFVSLELAPFALDLGTLALCIFGRSRGGEGLGIEVRNDCLLKLILVGIKAIMQLPLSVISEKDKRTVCAVELVLIFLVNA